MIYFSLCVVEECIYDIYFVHISDLTRFNGRLYVLYDARKYGSHSLDHLLLITVAVSIRRLAHTKLNMFMLTSLYLLDMSRSKYIAF